MLVDSTASGLTPFLAALDEAAKQRSLGLVRVEIRGPDDLDKALASLTQQRADGCVMASGSLVFYDRVRLAKLAKERHLPLIFNYRRESTLVD